MFSIFVKDRQKFNTKTNTDMRKLFLSLVLSFLVLCAYAEGISNYKELLAFAKAVNKEADISAWLNDKGEVCLKADIDMKKGKKFPTINVLKVTFDGCGYKLYNWTTKSSLFNKVEPAGAVKNLTIDASCRLSVKTAMNEASECISFIAKVNRGHIVNCVSSGAIEHTGEEAYKGIYIGAIAAINYNVIHNCKNTGSISTTFNFTKHTKGMALRIGGIVGTCYGKQLNGAVISCCENTGNISFMGDYPSNNVAGIVGESSKVPVKYCVNRGNIVAVGMPITTPKVTGGIRIAGITGWANNDVTNCENYGVVTVSGTHSTYVAGICARPNMVLNMVNCYNFGNVSANVSSSASVGGITGNSEVNIYLSNCYNFGNILNSGTVRQGWVGGISGVVTTSRKGLKKAAIIRDCVNYGTVTNKATYGNSTTGGVVAYCTGAAPKNAPVIKARIQDCASYGKIASADKHTDVIVGTKRNIDVVGKRYEDCARPVKPLKNGANIYGRVIDNNGMPVEGAVISDGMQSVQTDVNGEYSMNSNIANVHFVTVSVPAAYEIPLRDNRPQFFRRVMRNVQAVRADFVLTKRENPTDNFIITMIGDPQTRGLKSDKSIERFRDVILADVAKFQEKEQKEMYAINLGDLVYNWMSTYDDYVDVLGKATLPMFSAIGNHDYDQGNLFETRLGAQFFEAYLAPLNYSFNIGKMHFVILNTIDYSRSDAKARYKEGLDDATCQWLENDLKYVPKDVTIVVCGHAPIFKWRETEGDNSVNFERYSKLLAQYNKVYAWAGHTHRNYSYNYANSTKYPGLKSIEAIIVGRCIGQIRLNRELNTDGTPNGYMVAEVNGDKMEWYYKTVGQDRDYQMRVYSPTITQSEYVKANIWNHSPETWGTPEWWENGVKVADMVCSGKEFDPDYLKIYAQHNSEKMGNTERKYSKPAKVPFLFRVVPTAGVRSGEVRVTDNFGKTYIQKVEW